MGIPAFLPFLMKNYSDIFCQYTGKYIHKGDDCKLIGRLYIDCNSLIYDIIRELESQNPTKLHKDIEIIQGVIQRIDTILEWIQPKENTYLAFDGVAPLAKMVHQRTRRYKSWYESIMIPNENSDYKWNTVAITPGTSFMRSLDRHLSKHFHPRRDRVVLWGSNTPGEGEQKIFSHLRKNYAGLDKSQGVLI